MGCEVVRLGGGITAILCGRQAKPKKCQFCGCTSSKLCDYPVTRNGVRGTCDRSCCEEHSFSHGADVDYCLTHENHFNSRQAAAALDERQQKLFA